MRTVRISEKKLKLRIKIKIGIPFLNQHQPHEYSIECPLWHHKVSGPTNACLVIHVVTSWAYKKEVSQCIFVLVFCACDSLVSVCGRGLGPSVQICHTWKQVWHTGLPSTHQPPQHLNPGPLSTHCQISVQPTCVASTQLPWRFFFLDSELKKKIIIN